ncbi:MAG: AMP-binding protein, partial [Thermoanaerobaculia bacterium]
MADSKHSGPPAVAVVGMAGRFPGARDVEEFWSNLRSGKESVRPLADDEIDVTETGPEALQDPHYVKMAALLEDVELFDPDFFGFTQREAEITDPQHRTFLECAWQALENAGYDVRRFEGSVGVYAGSGSNGYLRSNLLPHRSLVRSVGAMQLGLGNDKDYLTTRVSYKLDLKGPSVNVQTACSTSLVAVHLAGQGLLSYECDLALAGGISIGVPQKVGYFYTPDGIASPDGHCRTFDADAAGTIFGSGVGVVVLKRLEEAVADGDTIYAVLRGSAINNDGALRAGFTAPGVDGQAGVISQAFAAAEVEPATVGYVEAHGTATPLGDPIEVAALTEVFRAAGADNGVCAIGSVKTNFGHLDAAAGIAGLIKTVLALHHGEIPPSLHFRRPNPEIDFDHSPFYVNTRLSRWQSNGDRRRAAVSSFGIGGSNAHVVLEEAPPTAPASASRETQLLAISTRRPEALDQAAENLARHLEQHPQLDLADVAYTLQVGRRAFEHRGFVVCRERGAATAGLRDGLVRHAAAPSPPPVVFLFPGQGAQYPDMGRELYQTETGYRRHVDACAEILRPHLGLDLRQLLHPGAGALEDARRRLDETAVTQPALFVVEYALARLWMEWGVEPRAMLGHSIGEWVAACLAGVFSLEDALALVAERGRRMQELSAGAMLSVPLGEDELASELGSAELSLAALNGPGMSVVSGPEEAIAAFEGELAGRGLETRRLHTSHAFHSPSMEAIVEPFAREVARRRRQPPRIPYLSNLSGRWIRDRDATDPDYWGRQLRQPVRFAAGLEAVLAETGTVLLEVGPGHSLATLARRHPGCGVAISSLRRPTDDGSDVAGLLSALGRLWLTGVEVDWPAFTAGERRRRVPLPTYPFDRRRCWIDPPSRERAAGPQTAGPRTAQAPAGEAEAAAVPAPPAGADEKTLSARGRPLLGVAYAEPRDELERTVVELWQDLLGVEPVGIDDDFFELGGHSLLATQLVTLIRQSTGADLPMRQLFEAPTPSQLATLIRESGLPAEALEELPAVTPDREHLHQPFPLTDVQQAYWIGRSGDFELGNVATHTYLEIDSSGLDLERFAASWQRVIDRHATLRTIIEPDGLQRVLEQVPRFSIPVLDLRRHDPRAAERELAEVRERLSHQVLPSDRWPLFEVRASRLDEDRWRIHLSYDFLLGDAWSWRILFEELQTFYRDPQAQLPALELTFRDCVLAEVAFRESQTYRRALDYWRRRLAELPPGPDLPLAKNPAAIDKPRFVRRSAELPAAVWRQLKERGSRAGLTPSGVLLAAFAEVLDAWSAAPRFTLNLTLFHRPPFHPQINDVIGDFTSLVLLAVDATSGDTFEERARHLQQQLWEDLDHRWVSGVRVQRELAQAQGRPGANAMPVVFTSTLHIADDTGTAAPEAESTAGDNQQVYSISQTPQVWIDHQVGEEAGALGFNWDVVEEIFPDGLVQEMFDAYCGLLQRLAAEEDSWRQGRRDSAQALLGSDELARQAAIDATAAPVPEGLLHQPFLARAERHPERPAVIAPERTLSYGDLEHRSRSLALRLQRLGARPDRLVAVVMDKGWEQVVAVLAILRAGAPYLPINASLPAKRVAYLLDNGEVEVALTQPSVEDRMAWPEGVTRLVVDDPPGDVEGELTETAAGPEDLAYVIFTSGSTGQPKGVMIDHRGALNTCRDVNRRFEVTSEDRVLALSSLSFDLSVWDVFGLLAAGGAVVLPEPEAQREPERWAQLMAEHRVTLWSSVPALMEMQVECLEGSGARLPDSLRLVMLSGDWIPVPLPDRIRGLAEGVELISLGGATEASIWSILYPIAEVSPEWPSIPYGKAMTHQTFH